jgi:outer membrane immunogenic protein
MRQSILGAALAVALTAATAQAADIPRGGSYGYTSVPAAAYSWWGPYVGANLGYQWAAATNSPLKPRGIVGGIQGGYNWQTGNLVYGVETDVNFSGADDTFAAWKFANPWFGTLRARAGYALNNILFYGTFGLAYGSLRTELGGASETRTAVGWTGGLGMEVGLTPNWSAKAEFLYVDLANQGFWLTGGNHGLQSSVFRLGVNYRF